MTEPTPNSPSRQVSVSGDGFFKSDLYLTYFRPAIYFTVAILFLLLAKFLHAGMMVALLGALSIIILTVSKIARSQYGLFPSMVFLLLMFMVNIWHWADSFFITIYSGNILVDKPIVPRGLVEGVIALAAVWFYHKLLKNLKIRISQEWFVKKSQLKFLVLLFFFEMFLLLFWITGFVVHTIESGSHYDVHEATLIAGIIALVLAGLPALIYLVRNQDTHSTHHHHRHHHHHHHPAED